MKRIPKTTYQNAAEIDERIRQLELDAARLQPDSSEHRTMLREIAKLRIYAEAKRWLARPVSQRA